MARFGFTRHRGSARFAVKWVNSETLAYCGLVAFFANELESAGVDYASVRSDNVFLDVNFLASHSRSGIAVFLICHLEA